MAGRIGTAIQPVRSPADAALLSWNSSIKRRQFCAVRQDLGRRSQKSPAPGRSSPVMRRIHCSDRQPDDDPIKEYQRWQWHTGKLLPHVTCIELLPHQR